jgi:hypothetical protein
MCPALSPATPSQPPAHTSSTPCTADTATTLDSMDGPPASVLLGSPVVSLQPLPRLRIPCCNPQVSCVSGAPDQVSDDEVPIPLLLATSPPRPFARAAATSPAESDDEVPIPCFSHRTDLVSCYGDAEAPLPRPSVSHLSSYTSPPIVRLNPPPRLAAAADALPGMVDTDSLLHLLQWQMVVNHRHTTECAFAAMDILLSVMTSGTAKTKPVNAGPAWNTRHPQHDKLLYEIHVSYSK